MRASVEITLSVQPDSEGKRWQWRVEGSHKGDGFERPFETWWASGGAATRDRALRLGGVVLRAMADDMANDEEVG